MIFKYDAVPLRGALKDNVVRLLGRSVRYMSAHS